MSYQVGVDVGGTFTTAAVARLGRAEVVSVVPSQLPGVPRGFLSRVGDDTPVLVGGRPVPAETLVAQLVRQVVSKIGTPTRLAVTHPVTWGPHRVAALRSALGEVTMLSTAAAVAYRSDYPTAVHDLGGSSFTAAVVRGFATVGQPTELDLGGADLDELVFDHVRSTIGDSWPAEPDTAALSRLRQACTAAKETLSSDTEVEIPVALHGIDTRVRLTRAEFEEMARPLLAETASALRMTIEESGLAPATVLLTGGAAWLPLLTQVVSAELGRPVTATPPGAAAIGAALAAGESQGALGSADFRNQAGTPAALRPATPSAAGAAGLSAAPSTSQGTDPRQGRPQAPTRLAVTLDAARFAAQGEARTSVVEPVRPPVPAAAAPVGDKPKRPRTLITAAAAAFVVVGAAAGIMLTSGQKPPGADAETMPATTTVTSTSDPVTTTEVVEPPVETPTRQTQQPRTRTTPKTTTTTTTTKSVAPTTTTTVPTTTGATKTSPTAPTSARTPGTTEGGER